MTAIIKLNDLCLAGSEGFTWPFVFGAEHPIVEVWVTSEVDRAMQLLPSTVRLEMTHDRFDQGVKITDNLVVKNVVIMRRDRAKEDLVKWVLSDTRFFLQGLYVNSRFNIPRPGNEFQELAPGVVGDYRRVPKLFFDPSSLKKRGVNEMANLVTESVEIWTAFKALKFLFTQYFKDRSRKVIIPGFGEFIPSADFSQVTDNDYPLSDHLTATSWPEAVRKLMLLANVGFFVDRNGIYQFRSLHPQPSRIRTQVRGQASPYGLPARVGFYDDAGTPIYQDRNRERSANPVALFEPIFEFRAHYNEQSQSVANRSVARGVTEIDFWNNDSNVENVTTIDADVIDQNGVLYEAGVIVEFEKALELYENDQINPHRLKDKLRLDLTTFRSLFEGRRLSKMFAVKDDRFDPFWAMRTERLEQDYRSKYWIKRRLMAGIDRIEKGMVGLADLPSGQHSESQVWMDETIIYNELRYVKKGSFTVGGRSPQSSVYSPATWPENGRTIRELPIKNVRTNDAEVEILDGKLGLFQIKFPQDREKNALYHIFGHIANKLPVGKVGFLFKDHLKTREDATLTDRFRMAALFTAVPNMPNNNQRLLAVEAKAVIDVPADAKGPPKEFLISNEPARYAWDDRTSRIEVDPTTGQVKFEGYRLINQNVLLDLARSRFLNYYFMMEDRQVGTFKAPGYVPEEDEPSAFVKEVGIQYGADGSLQANYIAGGPQAEKPLLEGAGDRTKRVILRLARLPK